jgi:hypothetical protein
MNATAAPVLVILSLHSSLISATAIFWPRHGAAVSEKTSGGYRWGLLAASAKSKGKPSSIIDGLLAATAIHHNLTIVSRNVGDSTNTQVPVVNP